MGGVKSSGTAPRYAYEPGLERVQQLLDQMLDPAYRPPYVHVVGSNGKGTTAFWTACLASLRGESVGLFHSPYLDEAAESIQVWNGGQPQSLAPEELSPLLTRAQEICPQATEFECLLAAALCYWSQQGCSFFVLEAGLGGRLDATNALSWPPAVLLFTALGLEHQNYLGSEFRDILWHKTGVLKPGIRRTYYLCSEYNSPEQLAELSRAIEAEAHVLGLKSWACRGGDLNSEVWAPAAAWGPWVAEDFILALRAVYGDCLPSREEQAQLFTRCWTQRPVLRQTWLDQPFPACFDGAHNPQALSALSEMWQLRYEQDLKAAAAGALPAPRLCLVFGLLADKDAQAAVDLLARLPGLEACICTAAQGPDLSRPPQLPQALAAIWKRRLPSLAIMECKDPAEAWQDVCQLAREGNWQFIICGSFYLARELAARHARLRSRANNEE